MRLPCRDSESRTNKPRRKGFSFGRGVRDTSHVFINSPGPRVYSGSQPGAKVSLGNEPSRPVAPLSVVVMGGKGVRAERVSGVKGGESKRL